MAGGQFLTLLHATSRSSLIKPTRPFFNNPTKKYGNRSRLTEERAPSTAEEFQRVADEKTKKNKEGADYKPHDDGAEHATNTGDSKNVESAKKKHKEH